MSRIFVLFMILALEAGALLNSQNVQAQQGDPIATAQAADQAAKDAQWRANQASGQAQSARATADAAYAEATAQAIEATRQADLLATAQAQQATATAVEATAESQATRQALEVDVTRSAIRVQETRAALEATRENAGIQATATRAAALAEQDRLTLERARQMQPLYTWGPWLLLAAIGVLIGLAVYSLTRNRSGACPDRDYIEAEWYDVPGLPLLPEKNETRCVLRPVAPGPSPRPASPWRPKLPSPSPAAPGPSPAPTPLPLSPARSEPPPPLD